MNKKTKLQNLIKYSGEVEVIRLQDKIYRTGYCSQCGMCCKTISMNTHGTADAIRWLKLHGIKTAALGEVVQDTREEAKEFTLSITFPCQCKELVPDGLGEKLICNIYPDRPTICRLYPRQTSSHNTCTYIFLETEDLNWFTNQYTKYWREEHGKEKKIKLTN